MKADHAPIIPDTVEYVIGSGNYSIIFLFDGRSIVSSLTLKYVTTNLGLTRIHKQHAVNPNYIKEVDLLDRVVMKSGKVLEVSRRKIREGVLCQIITKNKHGLTPNPNH